MLVPVIVPMLDAVDHDLYTEAFFGGGAIFFAKQPSRIEVINDLSSEIINFYRVVKSSFEDLKKEVDLTLHSRKQHQQAWIVYDNPEMFPEVKRAWAVWTLSQQSFSCKFDGGWGYAKTDNTCEKKVNNKKESFIYSYAERLQRVQIECNDAVKVIASRDRAEALHYCDPPYFNSDCGHYKGYTETDFERLLKLLQKVKGKFLLSSYPSPLLKAWIQKHGFYQVQIEKQVAVTKHTKRKKIEVLTANYDIEAIYEGLKSGKG